MQKFNRKQENNAMVQHTVYEIILEQKNKLSAEYEAQDKIDHGVDKNNIYKIDQLNLDENKEKK